MIVTEISQLSETEIEQLKSDIRELREGVKRMEKIIVGDGDCISLCEQTRLNTAAIRKHIDFCEKKNNKIYDMANTVYKVLVSTGIGYIAFKLTGH